jgi:hypothetical protein
MNQHGRLLFAGLIFLLFCNTIGNAQEQGDIKKTIRFGIECGDYFAMKSNSFTVTPGFTLGYMTGFELHRAATSSVILGIDAGYTRILGYDHQLIEQWTADYKYRDEYDTRHRYSFIELGVLPTILFPIGAEFQGSIYGGAYAGAGTKDNVSTLVSRTLVDSRPFSMSFEPYSYGHYIVAVGFSAGMSVYYKCIMLDFRYMYSSIKQESNYHNFYIQIGIVL